MRSFFRSAGILMDDLSGTLVFAILLAFGASVLVATCAGLLVAGGTVLFKLSRKIPIGVLQWLSLTILAVSGAATLVADDPRYMMAKPTIVAMIVGGFMLRPGWLMRYVPEDIGRLVPDITWVFGFVWAGLMFLTAALNLFFVLWLPERWIAFLAIFPASSKLTLFGIHFATSAIVAARRKKKVEALQV